MRSVWVWLSIAAASLVACGTPVPVSTVELRVPTIERLPEDPADPAWDRAPVHSATMLPQDLVEPRLIEPWATDLAVRAYTDGRSVAFKLSWRDPTRNDLPGTSRFPDACAIQLPEVVEADVPAPQMGEEGRAVEITFWRASWQAVVDGRPDAIEALYPGASIDHYPFEAPSLEPGSEQQKSLGRDYAPARALGNAMEGPRARPVEDLVSQGPGTLRPAAEQRSSGSGRRSADGWEVVIVRPLPAGLAPGRRSQIAFAVWDGERDNVGARKMRSGWTAVYREGEGG